MKLYCYFFFCAIRKATVIIPSHIFFSTTVKDCRGQTLQKKLIYILFRCRKRSRWRQHFISGGSKHFPQKEIPLPIRFIPFPPIKTDERIRASAVLSFILRRLSLF